MDLRSQLTYHACVLVELRDDVDHERDGRQALELTVHLHRADRSDDQSNFEFF